MEATRLRSRIALAAAGFLLAANVVVPILWGDVYPFTSAPMFRDCPTQCANYRVYAPDGSELPAENWLVQRVYDGNPVGYGVGTRPPAVIEQQFGVVHDEVAVRRHIEGQFEKATNRPYDVVEIVQEVIGPVAHADYVGAVRTSRWRVWRPMK